MEQDSIVMAIFMIAGVILERWFLRPAVVRWAFDQRELWEAMEIFSKESRVLYSGQLDFFIDLACYIYFGLCIVGILSVEAYLILLGFCLLFNFLVWLSVMLLKFIVKDLKRMEREKDQMLREEGL